MKALIVSDNHSQDAHLYELISKYEEEINLWLHCGDSEFQTNDPVFDYFKSVQGNMDWASFPVELVNELNGKIICHTHGHLYGVNRGVDGLNELATEEKADIVFYGHTHIAAIDKKTDVTLLIQGV